MANLALTDRWYPLKPHKGQTAHMACRKRFIINASARRTGKTEIAKRRFVIGSLLYNRTSNGMFVIGAPTVEQVRAIFWEDIKDLYHPSLVDGTPNETRMTIDLINGVRVQLVGLDKPDRIEGRPIDHFLGDEWATTKPTVWANTIRPCLSTIGRLGSGEIIGRPKGRNHYYDMHTRAKDPSNKDWQYFHWTAATLMPASEIAAAKAELTEREFAQEYEADWLTAGGLAYYAFDRDANCAPLEYDPNLDLRFAFDFNVDPGTATVIQEVPYEGKRADIKKGEQITHCIGEVYIPQDSNTVRVVNKLLADWGHHKGDIYLYGDPAGGHRGTAKVRGSDWDIIYEMVSNFYRDKAEREGYEPPIVARRIDKRDPGQNPRVNAVNRRLKRADGSVWMLVDDRKCPKLVRDFEGVTVIPGTDGEIDKKADKTLTHASDGVAYYCFRAHKRRI